MDFVHISLKCCRCRYYTDPVPRVQIHPATVEAYVKIPFEETIAFSAVLREEITRLTNEAIDEMVRHIESGCTYPLTEEKENTSDDN